MPAQNEDEASVVDDDKVLPEAMLSVRSCSAGMLELQRLGLALPVGPQTALRSTQKIL